MFLQKFSALSNEKHYLHGDLPRMGKNQDVLHAELCSLGKGHLLIVSPLPSALSLLEGTLKEHHCHVMCWCSPWLLPDTPQIQQNLLSPPVPFPGTSHDLFTATPAVMLLLLRRTGPPPAALTLLEFKHLLSGTSCRGLLFTAIKLC